LLAFLAPESSQIVKEWNFTVGKLEKEYVVEVNVKLSVKPK
jgi:hypothetical protein